MSTARAPSREATPDDPLHAALRQAICVPTTRYLWTPADAITFVPALSDTVYGDGRALLRLSTINSRPAFYVIRIDSRWALGLDYRAPYEATDVVEFIDQILWDLEEQFGCGRYCGDESECAEDCACRDWPALDDQDGCSWGRMDWPAELGVRLFPHPYSPQDNLIAREAA